MGFPGLDPNLHLALCLMFISLSSGEEATVEQTVFILQKTALDHFGAKNCIRGLIYKKMHSEPNLLQWPRSQQRDITLPLLCGAAK